MEAGYLRDASQERPHLVDLDDAVKNSQGLLTTGTGSIHKRATTTAAVLSWVSGFSCHSVPGLGAVFAIGA